MCDSNYMPFWARYNCRESKKFSDCQGLGRGGRVSEAHSLKKKKLKLFPASHSMLQQELFKFHIMLYPASLSLLAFPSASYCLLFIL